MKNKKAADRLGWKAEWIKEGVEEMVKSLYILFKQDQNRKSNTKAVAIESEK